MFTIAEIEKEKQNYGIPKEIDILAHMCFCKFKYLQIPLNLDIWLTYTLDFFENDYRVIFVIRTNTEKNIYTFISL